MPNISTLSAMSCEICPCLYNLIALYKNRLWRHASDPPKMPGLPTVDAADKASAGRILPPMEGLRDLLSTNGSTRIGTTIMAGYAASLKPTRTMNPCGNTAAPVAVPFTTSDDESGSTDCEPITDDGPDDGLGACVYGDDPSDHHPIDDPL